MSALPQGTPLPTVLLRPRFEMMPADLKALDQWVVWKGEWQPEKAKYSKIPFNARNGAKASSTDTATWSTFEEARRACETKPACYDGIGFVLHPDDPFAGVDLDHAIEGKKLSPEAARFAGLLDSYTEVSPSGTGLRIFVRGTLPPDGRKKGDVEMYEAGRFLTLTGRQWPGTPQTIEERQEALTAVHTEVFPPAPPRERSSTRVSSADLPTDDKDLLKIAFAAKNGTKTEALYGGSTSGYSGASEADLALCSLLAFYTGDNPARLDGMFRGSGLMRDKWDEVHYAGGETYGEHTVNKALAACTEFYSPPNVLSTGFAEKVKKAAKHSQALPQTENGGSPSEPGRTLTDFENTDGGNADRFAFLFGSEVRYVPGLGWRCWTGSRWDAGQQSAQTRSRDTVRALYAFAGKLTDSLRMIEDQEERKMIAQRAEELLKHARKSDSAPRIAAIVTLAAADPNLCASAVDFEPKPWCVGFPNGTWGKGEFREHEKTGYIENLTAVAFDAEADRTDWYELLNRITNGDTDLARMLQDVAGYCFSGASSMRILPWFYGPKGTGKSTFAELLQTAMGATAKPLDWSLLSGDREGEKLGSAVRGMRAIFLPEAGKKRLDADTLKMLSGGDRLSGRNLYQNDSYTVTPTWALIAVSNDPPNMAVYDDALRDRVRAIPFVHPLSTGGRFTFTRGEKLESYRRRTDTALIAGFVAWAVEGMERVYRTQEIHQAKAATEHTRSFWSDADPLTPFWEQLEDGARRLKEGIKAGDLRAAYLSWCDQEGVRRPLATIAWGDACRAYGLRKMPVTNGPDKGKEVWRLEDGGLFKGTEQDKSRRVDELGYFYPLYSEKENIEKNLKTGSTRLLVYQNGNGIPADHPKFDSPVDADAPEDI